MNKKEFIEFLAKENILTKIEAEKYIHTVIDGIQKALKEGNNIAFIGFGVFTKKRKEARVGLHPKTGKKIQISAYNQVSFKVGKTFKEMCQ